MQYQNDLILRAMGGRQTERTPIWLMRQAGRTDPAYLRMREEAGLPLEDLFRHPEYAAQITLLPERLGVDALILYQDILTPLAPLGLPFVFAPGPVITEPVDSPADLNVLEPFDVEVHLDFVGESLKRVHDLVAGRLPVLGFAGAPLTLAVFVLEGGSFRDAAPRTKHWMKEYPEDIHYFLDILTEMTIAYLHYQIDSGAAAVQLFESAAFVFSPGEYEEFALPYQQRVFDAIQGRAPSIMFARDWNRLEDLLASGADILSLPAGLSIGKARNVLGSDIVLQGNLDNRMLIDGSPEDIARTARGIVEEGQHTGHIFNLSHGLLKETPFENVQLVVDTVRAHRI